MRAIAPSCLRLAALALLATPLVACRAEVPVPTEQALAPLALTGRVVDAADVLPPSVEAQLAARSTALEKATGVQFIVVSTPSLNGMEVSDYTTSLGNGWGVGSKTRNDGLILLVAPNERKVRISTGLGLEERVTDAECQKIVDEMLINFRQNDLVGGVALGAERLDRLVRVKVTAQT